MQADVLPPSALDQDNAPPLSDYGKRFLAEGDSWFTFSTRWLPRNSNLLFGLDVPQRTFIANCAAPGDTLRHMVQFHGNPAFAGLLSGRKARAWDAILISAGGNDLIDAASVPARGADGQPHAPAERLLLTAAEAAAGPPGLRFVSEPGWAALARYLRANLLQLAQARDAGVNRNTPIILHTYHVPQARPSGVTGAPNGWLWPAMQAAGVPEAERPLLTQALFGRLRALWRAADADSGQPDAVPRLHVFDSAAVAPIAAATPGAAGASGDWLNEIHLTRGGYRTLGRAMAGWLWPLLRTRYGL